MDRFSTPVMLLTVLLSAGMSDAKCSEEKMSGCLITMIESFTRDLQNYANFCSHKNSTLSTYTSCTEEAGDTCSTLDLSAAETLIDVFHNLVCSDSHCSVVQLISCYQPFEALLNITLPTNAQQLQDLVKNDGNSALDNVMFENNNFCSARQNIDMASIGSCLNGKNAAVMKCVGADTTLLGPSYMLQLMYWLVGAMGDSDLFQKAGNAVCDNKCQDFGASRVALSDCQVDIISDSVNTNDPCVPLRKYWSCSEKAGSQCPFAWDELETSYRTIKEFADALDHCGLNTGRILLASFFSTMSLAVISLFFFY